MAEPTTQRTNASCLYLRRLSDVDAIVLRQLIEEGFADLYGRTVTPGSAWHP
jgi:hypothetical protein